MAHRRIVRWTRFGKYLKGDKIFANKISQIRYRQNLLMKELCELPKTEKKIKDAIVFMDFLIQDLERKMQKPTMPMPIQMVKAGVKK